MDAVGCLVSEEIVLDCEGGVNAVTFSEISSFELKPNPVSDVFAISFNAKIAGEVDMKIINALGNQVTSVKDFVSLGNNLFEFDASEMPAGTYLLLLRIADKTVVEKFVKIR